VYFERQTLYLKYSKTYFCLYKFFKLNLFIMKKNYKQLSVLIAILCISVSGIAQVTNLGAGFLANSASNNGEIIVGTIGNTHYIWTEASGLTPIGGVTVGTMGGTATISDDGSKISATVTNPNNNLNEMALYNVSTSNWTYLGGIGGQSDGSVSSAWSISGDGSTAVGLGWIGSGAHAIKWNASDGMVDMGSTVANRSSRANDVNNDGTVIVGWQDAATGFRQGAVWIDGEQTLITNQSGTPVSEAGAVSGDGNCVVGGGNNFEAWKWNFDTGISNISHPNSSFSFRGSSTAVNQDGSVIVGFYRPFPGPAVFGEGFIWTEATGRIELNAYVASLGMDTQGIIFALPLGISNDGTSIVGLGRLGNAQVGFMIKLPSAAANDLCEDAIVLTCGDIISGSTSNATDNGGNASPDVFYSYTGNGTAEMITISLCDTNTNFNTFLRVFTACDLTEEIAFNDNSCGDQSEVEFESDGTSTYYILVEGSGSTDSGEFTLEITCEDLLSTQENNLSQVSIYPNPVSDILNIHSKMNINKLEVYNVSGQKILTKQNVQGNQQINTSALQSGVYFILLISENDSKTIKLIKK
jgi:uncharacterized membrane protein